MALAEDSSLSGVHIFCQGFYIMDYNTFLKTKKYKVNPIGIGIELKKSYYDVACDNIKELVSQNLKLF